jgi:hypothetical protein
MSDQATSCALLGRGSRQQRQRRRSARQHPQFLPRREASEIVNVFEEPDVFGRKKNGCDLDGMIEFAKSAELPVKIIITYNLSRYARRLLTNLERALAASRLAS